MDANRFDGIVRALSGTPSRRAFNRVLPGLTVGSILALLAGRAGIEAKKKKKKKKVNWDKFCRQNYDEGSYCPNKKPPCCYGGDVCTDCGCCPIGYSTCCTDGYVAGIPDNVRCCADDGHCCFGPSGEVSCCGPEDLCCGGYCCPPPYNEQCCGGTVCCHRNQQCCPDGQCRLTC